MIIERREGKIRWFSLPVVPGTMQQTSPIAIYFVTGDGFVPSAIVMGEIALMNDIQGG